MQVKRKPIIPIQPRIRLDKANMSVQIYVPFSLFAKTGKVSIFLQRYKRAKRESKTVQGGGRVYRNRPARWVYTALNNPIPGQLAQVELTTDGGAIDVNRQGHYLHSFNLNPKTWFSGNRPKGFWNVNAGQHFRFVFAVKKEAYIQQITDSLPLSQVNGIRSRLENTYHLSEPSQVVRLSSQNNVYKLELR